MIKFESKELLSIFLIVLVDILSLTIVIPLLPFYAERYGASAQVVGLLITAFAFFQFVSGPILGELSDRIGRKPILILSQVGTFVGLLIFAQATALFYIFLARIIDGITAGNITVAQAYISDHTPPQKRAQAFAMIGVAFAIGFMLGPPMSGLLSGYGLQAPIYLACGLSFASILCTIFLLPKEGAPAKVAAPMPTYRLITQAFSPSSYTPFLKREELRGLLMQIFLFMSSFTLYIAGFALFAERQLTWNGHPFGAREVGYYMGCMGCFSIFVQAKVVGYLAKVWGEKKVVSVGFGAMGLGYALFGFVHSLWVLPVVALLANFGAGVTRPSIFSLVSQSAGRHEQGAVMGVAQSLGSIGQIIAPIIAGFLIEKDWLIGWSCAAGFVAAMALVFSKRANQVAIANNPQKITE